MNRKNYKSNTIWGKLRVCKYLSASRSLREYVPYTVRLTLPQLYSMSARYSSLYIKPDIGSLGIGVYKLNRMSKGYELLSSRNKRQTRKIFRNLSSVFRHIQAGQRGQKMIIQQAVKLGRLAGRPYDIRSMVQRKPGGSWVCTGIAARVGAPKRIVTNLYQGASMQSLHSLLRKKGMSAAERSTCLKRITAKSLNIAKVLSARRSGMHELGIDLALDSRNRLRILEVNSHSPQFHALKAVYPSAYRRMMSFARSYGRRSAN